MSLSLHEIISLRPDVDVAQRPGLSRAACISRAGMFRQLGWLRDIGALSWTLDVLDDGRRVVSVDDRPVFVETITDRDKFLVVEEVL